MVCGENDITRYVPPPPGGLLQFEQAVSLALARVREANVITRWSSASVPGAPAEPLPHDPDWAGGSLYTDDRSRVTMATPAALWRVIEGSGAITAGTPSHWHGRSAVDGPRRRRRRTAPRAPDEQTLRVGETVDFWRVEERVPEQLLRLRAEMRLPGLAWLELRVERDEDDRTVYHQRAIYHPRGIGGHAYWWSVAPSTASSSDRCCATSPPRPSVNNSFRSSSPRLLWWRDCL